MIGFVGAVIGCVLSWLLVAWPNRVGIDFSAMFQGVDLGDYGEIYALMGTHLYPAISGTTTLIYGLAAVVISALAALYPAWQAAQRELAESLH